jgi:hypothetical protein
MVPRALALLGLAACTLQGPPRTRALDAIADAAPPAGVPGRRADRALPAVRDGRAMTAKGLPIGREVICVSALICRRRHAGLAIVASLRCQRSDFVNLLRPQLSPEGRHLPSAGGPPACRADAQRQPMPYGLVAFPQPNGCRHALPKWVLPCLEAGNGPKSSQWIRAPGWALEWQHASSRMPARGRGCPRLGQLHPDHWDELCG